jgi:hypothetical protein
VANGSGGCIDACNPNRCAAATPTCTRTGNKTTYSCACTSTSCGAGKQCSGSSCTNCAPNASCGCPGGQVANGSGGCVKPACSSNSDCGAGKQCVNAGTTSASCQNCGVNSQCTCPSGQLANGSGGCVKPVCYDNTPCGAGRQCIDPGKYNAKCDPCPTGSQCTCPSGQVADGSGGCGSACPTAATCAAQNGGSEGDWKVADCKCTSTKKYILTNEKITYAGRTLYRIKALQDINFKKEYTRRKDVTDCGDQTLYSDDECQQYVGMSCSQYYSYYNRMPTAYKCYTYQTNEVYDTLTLAPAKAGDLGGYIEKEANLTNTKSDMSWVGGNAKVYGDAKVSYGALVTGQAVVSGGSVSSNAYVRDNATITGGSVSGGEVYEHGKVTAGSVYGGKVFGYAQNNGCSISDSTAKLYGNAIVKGCEIHENVEVYGNARIHGQDVRLWGNVKIYDSAQVGSQSQIYIKGNTKIYGSARVFAKKNWNASPGYQHQTLTGNNLNIGGTVKFCDNSKKSGTYTSGTVYGSWEGQCNPTF